MGERVAPDPTHLRVVQEPATDELERHLRSPASPLCVGPGRADHRQGGPPAQVVPGRAAADKQVRAPLSSVFHPLRARTLPC